MVYYNENSCGHAQWLRNLASDGKISEGIVDDRDIKEIKPADLAGIIRAHFFAGIAGWEIALQYAGWPDDWPVWTGSCPCQPFSSSGKRRGFSDERHLWPHWFKLIVSCSPSVVFGEQVDSKDAKIWLDRVWTDMENEGYAFNAVSINAAGIGAPHIRQRLYWVANTENNGFTWKQAAWPGGAGTSYGSWMGKPNGLGLPGKSWRRTRIKPSDGFSNGSPWQQAIWITGQDGKTRRIKSRISPLAHGVSKRVVKLRGYGNAIVPQLAAEFIGAFMDTMTQGSEGR